MSLPALLAGAQARADGFALTIPEDWHQGRTAYGGLSAALALEAARRLGGAALPPLCSALISFVGPIAGDVLVSARVLRQGRNATWIAAEIGGAGGCGLAASFVFMRRGTSRLALAGHAPPAGLIPLAEAKPVKLNAFSPVFLAHHFDLRFAQPRGPAPLPEICWWVRPRATEGLAPETQLLLCADALPPGVLPLLDKQARVSSMTWQFNLLDPAPATSDGWWLLRVAGEHAGGGMSSERLDVWNAEAAPMATGQQAVALFD